MRRHTLVTVIPVVALAALAVLAAGCGSSGSKAKPTPQPTQPAAIALPASPVKFAAPAPVPPVSGAYAGPATPTSLDGVKFVGALREELAKPGVSETLARQGFVVLPGEYRLFHYLYDAEGGYNPWPTFVTTDVATHEFHLMFDKLLRTLEQAVLLPKLEQLVTGLVEAAHAQTTAVAGTDLEDAAARVEQLYQVAAAALGLPGQLGPLAEQEKALVDAHSATASSPLTGVDADYSLYTPRGHYTRNADLRRYFVAMSVLGQAAFCLPGTRGCAGVEPARRGILAARVLGRDPGLVALWRTIYEPTAFLVGASDDYTAPEVAAAAGPLDDPSTLAGDDAVRTITDALVALRPVQVNPERASIRIMGTRFVVDAYVLDQLLAPNVGTNDKPRLVGSGLDIAAAFGSTLAYDAMKAEGKTDFANYDAQLAALRAAIVARPEAQWSSTVVDAWLHALAPSFAVHGEEFPDFMRTAAWAAKALQSGLGSYTELKHDTLLYAKQALAEGGGDEPPAVRRNWVEPEPLVFGRLAAAAELIRSGLRERAALPPEQATLVTDEIELFRFLERIARDELKGAPIEAADNERLTYLGGWLESLFWRTADQIDGGASADLDAAVVADIQSGPDGVLELGTGRISRILVLVPDDSGAFQVAQGGVYSYYEFTSPPGVRLTDEEWRAQLDAGEAPARPAWQQVILPG
jgi:hypothetical protein